MMLRKYALIGGMKNKRLVADWESMIVAQTIGQKDQHVVNDWLVGAT